MGSPETENWRIEDETQHEVSVSAFYIDPYETTQADYVRLMGANPSDFSGKQILPFCSHGGGRFGQSLTAIAKLAPDANLGESLSVHYSGGAGLPDNVSAWLEKNNIDHG